MKSASAVGILAKIGAADQEIVIDDLEHVIEALPWRIQILEQNVFPRLERARIVPHVYLYLLSTIAGVNPAIGIAGDSDVFAALFGKPLAKAGENRGGHGVQYMALRKEALPEVVIANGLSRNIDGWGAALIHQGIDAHGWATAEERLQLSFVIGNHVERIDAGHTYGHRGRRIRLAAQLLDLAFHKTFGERGNGHQRIDAQSARNHRPIGHMQPVMHAAITCEDATIRISAPCR